MMDLRRSNLADILVNYCVKVQPKEWVVITGSTVAQSLMNDIMEKTLQAGGHPSMILNSGEFEETRLKFSTETQLQWVSPFWQMVYEKADVIISVWATENLRAMNHIPADKGLIEQTAMQGVLQTFSQRMSVGELKWVGTQFPCHSYAQEAEMSLREYEDFVYSATLADQPDAVSAWQKIKEDQQRYVNYLGGKKLLHIRGSHADLKLSIEGRSFLNDGGEVNMPGGEIYTSPVENSANGWIRFNYPAIERGHEVQGIRLEFRDGKVINASADKNEAFLLQMLDVDEGARFLGEFAIGTNYGIQKFSKSILFDEKIGGTFHIALGNGFLQAGGQNKSSLHWDLICDIRPGEISADGEVFYRNGEFVL